MRRIVLALLGTVIGTTVLIGLKSPGAVTQLGLSAAAPADPTNTGEPGASQAGASLTPTAPGASAAAGGPSAGPTTGAGNTPPAGAPTTTKPPTATAPKTTAAAPPASRTILGDPFPAIWQGDNYGNMQVKIVVTGKHIDSAVTVQQSNRPKTVAKTLGDDAVKKQSANLINVSGATASSDAYKKSLQSAIAKI
jgi:uncharacterized protein with FMN-binding domain